MTYAEKLKDPRWQKKRLKIFNRDEWTCQRCCDKKTTLHVHHLKYQKGIDPWDYPDRDLVTLCENCHETISEPTKQISKKEMKMMKEFMNYDLSKIWRKNG